MDYFQSRGGALLALLPVKPVSTLYSSPADLFAWTVLIGTAFLLIGGMIGYKRQSKFKKRMMNWPGLLKTGFPGKSPTLPLQ
ncbi:hypothetical protein ACFLRT_04825 [Acidobacteriota bacterium]